MKIKNYFRNRFSFNNFTRSFQLCLVLKSIKKINFNENSFFLFDFIIKNKENQI